MITNEEIKNLDEWDYLLKRFGYNNCDGLYWIDREERIISGCHHCLSELSSSGQLQVLVKEDLQKAREEAELKERRRIFEWVLTKPEVRQTEIFNWLKKRVGSAGKGKGADKDIIGNSLSPDRICEWCNEKCVGFGELPYICKECNKKLKSARNNPKVTKGKGDEKSG